MCQGIVRAGCDGLHISGLCRFELALPPLQHPELIQGLRRGSTYTPHLWACALFVLGFIGLLIGIYPYIVPYGLTIQEAAAAPNAQGLLLVGAAIMLPVIIGHTAYVYWVFRGKVSADAGYH